MNLPILIIGYERSGTTLLRRLVSMHPNLEFDLIHEKWQELMAAKTKEKVINVLTFPSKQAGKKTGGMSSIRSGQKIPYADASIIRENIEKFYSFFPDTFLLHIIREPLTTINSQIKTFDRKPLRCIKNWFASVPLVYKYARAIPNSRVVCYEDLTTNPRRVLSSIYKWMGQEVDDEHIEKVITTNDPWNYNGRQMPGLRRFGTIIPPERELILKHDIIAQIQAKPSFEYEADFGDE